MRVCICVCVLFACLLSLLFLVFTSLLIFASRIGPGPPCLLVEGNQTWVLACLSLSYVIFFHPEDGEMYLLVPAHLGCPGQSPESCKMVVCVCDLVFLMNGSFVCLFVSLQCFDAVGWATGRASAL